MKAKIFIAGLVTGIISFILGALTFGILGDYIHSNTIQYDGLFRNPPNILCLVFSNISWGILIAYILSSRQNASLLDNFVTGALVFTWVIIGVELYEFGTKNLYKVNVVFVEIFINLFIGGIRGIVAGAVLRLTSRRAMSLS